LYSLANKDIDNATQIQQNTTDHKVAKINQIIEEIEEFNDVNSYNALLKSISFMN